MRPVCHSLGHGFVVLTSAKSNAITNFFLKAILVQKIAYSHIYDITMSREHFEIKTKICILYNCYKWTAINCVFKFRL